MSRRIRVGVALLLAVGVGSARAQGPSGASPEQQLLQGVANLNQGIALLAHDNAPTGDVPVQDRRPGGRQAA